MWLLFWLLSIDSHVTLPSMWTFPYAAVPTTDKNHLIFIGKEHILWLYKCQDIQHWGHQKVNFCNLLFKHKVATRAGGITLQPPTIKVTKRSRSSYVPMATCSIHILQGHSKAKVKWNNLSSLKVTTRLSKFTFEL